jgi:hypothetical protein
MLQPQPKTNELSPLEVILLEESQLTPKDFCIRDHYVEGVCEVCGCHLCPDLMGKVGTA